MNGSTPMKPTSGWRAAWAARCSPPPNPISSQIARGRVAKTVWGSSLSPGSSAILTRGSSSSSRRRGSARSLGPWRRP
jgi:hypothetical protein